MLNGFWTYLQYGRHFCGIEHSSVGEKNIINSTLLKKTKNELLLKSTFKVETIKELCNGLPNYQHAVLILNDDNVVSKQIQSEQTNPIKIVHQAFLNISLDDFYFELLSVNSTHFVSICRKSVVHTIIRAYTEQNVSIIGLSFGNCVVSSISQFIEDSKIYSSNAIIDLLDCAVISIENSLPEHKTYDINGISISNTELLSFSGALQCVINYKVTKTNFKLKVRELIIDFRYSRFFNKFLKLSGLLILVMLLINFFFFSFYFKKANAISHTSNINSTSILKMENTSKSVAKKQERINDILKRNSSKSSFYVNQIVRGLPKEILLNQVNYQPLIGRVKSDKEIMLEANTIEISGVSNESELFSKWIGHLELQNWIDKIEIKGYGSISEKVSKFTLKVYVKNEL